MRSLRSLYARFAVESSWLIETCESAIAESGTSTRSLRRRTLLAEMTVLRLHDAWARFCRQLVVVSAGGRPLTAGGSRLALAPGITTPADVVPVLLGTYRKRKYEPRWAVPHECVDAAGRLRLANLTTVAGAIGAIDAVPDDLRVVRNFFAHRGHSGALEVRGLSVVPATVRLAAPSVLSIRVAGGITLIKSWSLTLQATAAAAVQ